ncbi:MAG: dihydrolipoyl dehydrogenase [Armatimonadetes bacterium]|nr:dihydrolipoyl dehydrogenase [Armatimonadota bacterium]
MAEKLDLVVIGSGPGGYVAAIRAAQLGLNTAIVEKHEAPGGTCLHRGCIPTKALLHTADLLDICRKGRQFGLSITEASLDMGAAHGYKNKVMKKLSKGIEYLFKKNGVLSYTGRGRLEGAGRVVVVKPDGTTESLGARFVLIATGSVPKLLPGLKGDGVTILTSDEILNVTRVPERLTVLGAGAVGVEFASMFLRFGSKVTLVEMLQAVVPVEDEEISQELERSLKRQGMTVLTGTRYEGTRTDSGLLVTVRDAQGQTQDIPSDLLLVATGRGPYTEGLGFEGLSLEMNRGFVCVDSHMQTSVPGVYAIGDVAVPRERGGKPMLAHVASAEGLVAVEHMVGQEVRSLNYDRVPGCTYCFPEVASVGLTEKEARDGGRDVRIGKFPYGANSKAAILGEQEGFVKIVSDARYDEVLGVHMIGPRVTEQLAEACVSLQLEATSQDLALTIHAHPTLSEAFLEAAHAVSGHPIHI